MKQLVFLLVFSSLTISAQSYDDVDAKVLNYPRYSNVENLASQIQKDFSTDEDKARAAFFWLAKNIRYNLKEYYKPQKRSYRISYATELEKEQKYQLLVDVLVDKTFKNKTGVCEEYAQSFKKICDLLDIEAEVIKGNVRNTVAEIGNVTAATNHAWNAVKIDEKWLILDATWAAGYEYNGKWVRDFNYYFYDIPKDKILKSHYPEDALWVLRFGRMSKEAFYNQPIYSNNFLGLEAELIAPTEGIISLNSEDVIELKFKNLTDSLLIFYVFKGSNRALKPAIIKEGKFSIVKIPNPKKNTDLVLFINKIDALHFKIKQR
ncbi:transglutaminase domain-containing protein [Polaribacter sp. MED152]|uniref:transglutaminase domain-containing protein n=1 Tax=Polaribacter sp. MED152 TaxID=313598 RepID=UPI0000689AF1|nr:transglutaminase domain-containing protein [Polaribacter sp. MED152]EAQ40815.1 transglutaminase [Polaribacter sp. MED152]